MFSHCAATSLQAIPYNSLQETTAIAVPGSRQSPPKQGTGRINENKLSAGQRTPAGETKGKEDK